MKNVWRCDATVHATSAHNVPSITRNILDWRRNVRTEFGEGVSFSPDATYRKYVGKPNNTSCRAVIIAKGLVHSRCSGRSAMELPFRTDTSKGWICLTLCTPSYNMYINQQDEQNSCD